MSFGESHVCVCIELLTQAKGASCPRYPHPANGPLAEMVDTKMSRVSIFMKFRSFVTYNGTLEVHTSLLNVALHDNPHVRRRSGEAD
jgi:CRP/FNR family transcriptional regulator, cyclic AMP receptor protein